MQYEDELRLLNHLGKGKKAKPSSFHQQYSTSDKYWRKASGDIASNKRTFVLSLENMLHTASGKTQAIFKISSYGKGQKRIAAHLSYISRRGRLELEDQDGTKVSDLKSQRETINNWSSDFGKRIDSRDTVHLVLSTPPGSDRESALKAAKEFLAKEFKENHHDYLFVAHNDTNHPHVHAVIKMVSHLGNKLDPRKAYLNRVRQDYAEICRSHGIQVEASSRAERGLAGQSEKSEFVQMKKSNRKPEADVRMEQMVQNERCKADLTPHASEEKMIKRNQIIRKRYADKANALAQKSRVLTDNNEKEKYNNAARKLYKHAKTMPVEISRSEKIHRELDDKFSAPNNRKPRNIHEVQDEYHAVTLSKQNEKGIYESPTYELARKITNIIVRETEKEVKRGKGNAREMEIDFD